jgi:pimeloyl-ACP methyl ester carboxylesterase
MLKLSVALFAIIFTARVFAQGNSGLNAVSTGYNLDFERMTNGDVLPDLWARFNIAKGYKCEATTAVRHGGNQSLLVERVDSTGADGFASVVNAIPAKYLGKEIEFKAWLKFQDVKDFVGIMIRIDDANGQTIEFKSLQSQHINGTKDWTLYTIKAPIPDGAQTIYVANILGGPGKLWTDDAQVLIGGKDISQAPVNIAYTPNPPRYGKNPLAEGRVKLKDAEIYYETYGSGEPLLLLHGNSQSIRAFSYQIGDFSKKFRVIAVDSRGQGKSTDETTGPLSYDLFADDMRQLLDSLHIKKTNILGWSDGGNTGLIMAIKYPQYVNKLAVMGANLFPTNEAVHDSVLTEVKAGLANLQTKSDATSKMEVRLFTLLLKEPHLTFDELKTIKAPTLIMAGEHDLILDSHTRAIAAAIPKAKLVIFTGATHYAPLEIPKWFNQTVIGFL